MAVRPTQAFPPGVLALLLFVVLAGVALYGVWDRVNPQGPTAETPSDLQAFIETAGMRMQEASGRQDNEVVVQETKLILDAADKLLAAEPSEEHRVFAIRSKLTSIAILVQAGEPGSVDALRSITRAHFDDADPEIATLAAATWLGLESNLVGSQRSITEEMAATLAEAVAIYGAQTGRLDYNLLQYGVNLIAVSESPRLAAAGYRKLAELSEHFPVGPKDVAIFKTRFERAASLMDSVGQPIELKGALLDGSALDWAACRDQVVLVYFFSVVNEQFVEGLPDLQRLYEGFHDRGFQIVGVSVDGDRDVVEKFVKSRRIRWPVLFSDDPAATGMDHPLAVQYGILLPNTRILLDREGNVVCFNAFGKKLERYLEEQFGPIETPAETAEPAAEGAPAVDEEAPLEPVEEATEPEAAEPDAEDSEALQSEAEEEPAADDEAELTEPESK